MSNTCGLWLVNPSQCSGIIWFQVANAIQVYATFLISDTRALWRSALSARVPECQKLKTQIKLDAIDHFYGCNYLMPLHSKGLIQQCSIVNYCSCNTAVFRLLLLECAAHVNEFSSQAFRYLAALQVFSVQSLLIPVSPFRRNSDPLLAQSYVKLSLAVNTLQLYGYSTSNRLIIIIAFFFSAFQSLLSASTPSCCTRAFLASTTTSDHSSFCL